MNWKTEALRTGGGNGSGRSAWAREAAGTPRPESKDPVDKRGRASCMSGKVIDSVTKAGGGYSPDDFYTFSVDQRGHGTTYHVKVPDAWVPMLQEVKEQIVAYRTVHDLIRDALYHRLRYLLDEEGVKVSERVQQIFDAYSDFQNRMNEVAYLEKIPENVESLCAKYQRLGDRDALKIYLEAEEDRSEFYPDPYRHKVQEILSRYRVGVE